MCMSIHVQVTYSSQTFIGDVFPFLVALLYLASLRSYKRRLDIYVLLLDLFDMFPRDIRWFLEAVTCTKQCSLWWESLMVTDIILKVKVTWLIARNMLFHGARITPVGSKGYCENCGMSNSIKLSRWDYLNWISRFGVYGFRSTVDFIHTLSILSTLVLPYTPRNKGLLGPY